MAKLFSWVGEKYPEQAAVPRRIQQHMRQLWLAGATTKEIAEVFAMPLEWVEDFARDASLGDTDETSIH
jgi:hypothetical protein